jgi:WD40 repeat protein/energy-coupling factor transporter ATP-binding protein EcfA2
MTLPSYVGRYEVRREIARGGFAVVVQAWDEELQSLVAIKILLRELADKEDIQRRFVDEARLLRRIRSPSVITVHDVGRLNDGLPYFVMDFADCGTLAARLERGPAAQVADQPSIMALADAVADGLSAIHEAGVVHRDIKPANILFQSARRGSTEHDEADSADRPAQPALIGSGERILVGDLGIAKDVLKHGHFVTLIGGTPLYRAPEQGDDDAEITPAADVYSATALLWHVLTGHRPPEARDIRNRMSVLPMAWHEVIEQGMALDPSDRFASMAIWRAAVHDALAQEAAEEPNARLTEVVVPTTAECPYKGLAAYQPDDAPRFFGREALIDDLVRRLQMQRVLVVGGPSGSGKSSVVRAGLIPALSSGALLGSESWRVVLFTPGRDPLGELYFQVKTALGAAAPAVSLEDLLARPTLARHLVGSGSSQPTLLLCIDQFEELFTLAPPGQLTQFISALSAMTDPADSRVRIAIVVRADFYAACAEVPWLAERITDNQVLVGPMSNSELRRAISEPARRVGLYLERGLVDAVIAEAGHEAGSLPLVAHALMETWLRRQGNALTLEGFRAAGGVAGAISQTADATYEQRFNSVEQAATRRLFLRLVTPGESTPDTRRVVARSEIDRDSQPDVMHRVIDCLTEARLLTVDNATVQIAHEALLRTWPRLRSWIEDSRDDLRTRQRISHAAAEWGDAKMDPDLLYRGTPLLSALEWVGKHPDQLGERECAFLDASLEAKAGAEAAAADKVRRSRRVRRIAIAGLSFLAVSATIASIAAFLAFREAKQNEDRAKLATAEARERFAGALGAAARGLVDSDPLLALSLAAEAVARAETGAPGYDARAAMFAARQMLTAGRPILVGSPLPAGDALAIAVSPNGSLVATAQRDGTIEIIDAATRQRVGPAIRGHDGGVQDLDFAPDGRSLASVGHDGLLQVWTIEDGVGGGPRRVAALDDVVWGVRYDPTGSVLASAGEDGTVRLWDAHKGGAIGEPLIQRTGDFLSVAFAPNGLGLIAGNGEGDIYGWELPSGTPLFEPIRNAHTSDVWELVFSPDGGKFATVSSDGTSVLLDYPSGRIAARAFAGVDRIAGVVFTPDGKMLIGGAADGALRLWDVARGALALSTMSGHSQPIIDAGISGDGRLLATLGKDQLIRIWRFDAAFPLAIEKQIAGKAAKGVALSDDGALLAAGDDAGTVQVWNLETGRDPTLLLGHAEQVWALAFAPDGSVLASGDRAGQVRLWDLSRGVLKRKMSLGEGSIWSLAFTADGHMLMAASDMRVQLWDVDSGQTREEFATSGGRITRAALSPTGSLLAASSTDGTVNLWSLDKSTADRQILVEDDVVWSVAFSPDGLQLATASSDEVVALWDVATGRQQAALTGHVGGATDVVYLGDGVTLAATDRSGRLHLWDAHSRRRLVEAWRAHANASWRTAVHPDGQRFATTGDDGRVNLWDGLSIARACDIGAPALDVVRREQYLGAGELSVACGPAK